VTFGLLKDASNNSALLDDDWKCRKCGRLTADHLVPEKRQEKKEGILYPILSYPILSYPILSYPILSYPILSYPILSYPILLIL
jgi:hypothetical protein